MYPHFIEVHARKDNVTMSININNIIGFGRDGGTGTGFKMADNSIWVAKETYEETKRLVQNTGCLIAKGDPRLNTSNAISWEELTKVGMIGEPVWNSNSRRWMLLIDSSNDRTWIELINDAGGHEKWIEHDAQAKPLYRMRQS